MGLSFSKLVVLAAIVLIVWYGAKYMRRVDEVRNAARREADERRAAAPQPSRAVAAQDLVKCERCGAYVAASACGRPDCPWAR